MNRRGFTLLEMLVATTIMGIAVVGLLANLSTSMRNAARLTDYDRAALLAKRKMDELLLDRKAPEFVTFGGEYDRSVTGGSPAGWQARITPFEIPPTARPGSQVLERVELEIWWKPDDRTRTFRLEGFRRGVLPADSQERP